MDVGYDRGEILEAIRQQISRGRLSQDLMYGQGQAGVRIADLLADVTLTFEKKLTY